MVGVSMKNLLKVAKAGTKNPASTVLGGPTSNIADAYFKSKGGADSPLNDIFNGTGIKSAFIKSKKGTRNPNVITRVSNIGRVKGIIGDTRIANLEKAVKNRNARLRRQVKALTGEAYTYENYLKLSRAGYLPPVIRVDFSKITSVKDYNALMRMIEADKTPQWKADRLDAMRDWLKKSVKRSIWIDEDDDPELFQRINEMSEKEILAYRRDYKGLIGEIFDYYVDDQAIDADDRETMWVRIRRALGLVGEIGANPIIAV